MYPRVHMTFRFLIPTSHSLYHLHTLLMVQGTHIVKVVKYSKLLNELKLVFSLVFIRILKSKYLFQFFWHCCFSLHITNILSGVRLTFLIFNKKDSRKMIWVRITISILKLSLLDSLLLGREGLRQGYV